MADNFTLQANLRKEQGKANSRRLRRIEDRIPAVVYGGADKEAQSITLSHNEVIHLFAKQAAYSHILSLQINGQEELEQVVLKAMQRHAYKPKIIHIDFLRVSAKEQIVMQVPIHLLGEEDAPGLKSGGVLTKSMTEVEIRCLPADLPESIDLDISKVELDQVLHLSDLKLPSGVELTVLELDEEHNHPVAGVHTPRVVKEDVEAEQHEAEQAEDAAKEAPEAASGEEGKKDDDTASKDKKE